MIDKEIHKVLGEDWWSMKSKEMVIIDEQQKLLNKLKHIYENMTAFTWPNGQYMLMVPIEAVLKVLEDVRAELTSKTK